MEKAWETIRLELDHIVGKNYPKMFVWTKQQKKSNKMQNKESIRPF